MLLPKLNSQLVDSLFWLDRCIANLHRAPAVVFDIETTGLDRHAEDAKVNTLILGTHNRQWVIPFGLRKSPWHYNEQTFILESILDVLNQTGAECIAQNGKFDNMYLETHYNVKFPLTFDTMLAKALLDENTPSGLKWCTMHLLNGPDYDVDLDTKLGKKNLKAHLKYAAYDGLYEWLLYWRYKNELEEDPVLNRVFRELMMPVARAYEVIEQNGVYIDTDRLQAVGDQLRTRQEELLEELNEFTPINWSSPKQIGNYLYKEEGLEPIELTKTGAPSTREHCLKVHLAQKDHDCIVPLMELRGVNQLVSFYIDGWTKLLVNDCWLYPKYKINGTVTGRPSCELPNIQQTPRLPKIRSLVSAPYGWKCFEADYSQVELRVVAEVAQEREMLRIFFSGGDIHEETYQMFAGMSTLEAVAHIKDPAKRKAQLKEERKKAKAINFGFIYGMGWSKFITYAFDKYDLIITAKESKMFRKLFFQKYPDLIEFHDKQRNLVRMDGYVRTLTGRIRHLPNIWSNEQWESAEAERQAINSPIQGMGAEMTLMALPELVKLDNQENIKICATIHDATLGRVRGGHEYLLEDVRRIMIRPQIMKNLGIKLEVPILVDIELGDWGVGKTFLDGDFPK